MKSKRSYKDSPKTRGFSLVEVLVYMTVLTVVISILVASLTLVAEFQERVAAGKAVDRSAAVALDRIIREVRLSDSIDMVGSVLDEPDGVLVLQRDGVGTTTFSVSEEGELYVNKNGIESRLTHRRAEIVTFMITELESGFNGALRVELLIRSSYSDGYIEQTFYSTALLRGAYGDQ